MGDLMDLGIKLIKMGTSILGNTKMDYQTAKGDPFTPMEACIYENIRMVNFMVRELSFGKMDIIMMGNSEMGHRTVRELKLYLMVI